jgi:hypothetical protein
LPPHPPQPLEVNKHAAQVVADNPPQKVNRHTSATPGATHSLGCGGVADKMPILGGRSQVFSKAGKSDFLFCFLEAVGLINISSFCLTVFLSSLFFGTYILD